MSSEPAGPSRPASGLGWDSDKTAVIAVAVSLLIDGFAVLVLVKLVKLARNWRRHRQIIPHRAAVGTGGLGTPSTRVAFDPCRGRQR
jgi:hypothetical protein